MGAAMKTPHVQEELRTSSFIVHLSRQAMFTPAESKQGLRNPWFDSHRRQAKVNRDSRFAYAILMMKIACWEGFWHRDRKSLACHTSLRTIQQLQEAALVVNPESENGRLADSTNIALYTCT